MRETIKKIGMVMVVILTVAGICCLPLGFILFLFGLASSSFFFGIGIASVLCFTGVICLG